MEQNNNYFVIVSADEAGESWGFFTLGPNGIERHGFADISEYSKLDIYYSEGRVVIDYWQGEDPSKAICLDEKTLHDPIMAKVFSYYGIFNCLFIRVLGRWEQCNGVSVFRGNTKDGHTFILS